MNRIFLISDTHIGIRNNSSEWFKVQLDYFENFLLPKSTPDDILFILGDIFDNRNILNVYIMHQTINVLFKKLSESFKEIHILVGNHDMYFKDSNRISSIDMLKYPNIYIYKEPTLITINKQKFLFIPYYENKLIEKEILQSFRDSKTICLMHTDIAGFYYNKNIIADINSANDISSYAGYKHIFSGHFHLRQQSKNITYLGSPYQLDRNDIGNRRGLYYLSFENGKIKYNFVENDYSPEFIKLTTNDIINNDEEKLANIINNNYVDILVQKGDIVNLNLHNRINQYKNAKDIKIQIIEPDEELNIVYTNDNKFDLLQLYKQFIVQYNNISIEEYNTDINKYDIEFQSYNNYIKEKLESINL